MRKTYSEGYLHGWMAATSLQEGKKALEQIESKDEKESNIRSVDLVLMSIIFVLASIASFITPAQLWFLWIEYLGIIGGIFILSLADDYQMAHGNRRTA